MAIKLKGHETFSIREGWLSKGLRAVYEDKYVFSKNYGADALGVGSNMAKAIKYYLKTAELIKITRNEAKLNGCGKTIYKYDPYFEDVFSLWIFHVNFVRNREQATSWYLFFNEIDLEEFTKEELEESIEREIEKMGIEKYSKRSIHDDVSVLTHMYCKEKMEKFDPEEKRISPFVKLGLITKNEKKYQKSINVEGIVGEKVTLYIIAKYLQDKGATSVSIDELLTQPGTPGKIMNLKRAKLNELLDRLQEKKELTVNRTAGLDMVYYEKEEQPEKIVEDYYAHI